jgi:hypothetical protein
LLWKIVMLRSPLSPVVWLLLASALPTHAGVYKCASDQGVVYQDTACVPGKELRNLETDPATLSVVPGTPVPQHDAMATAGASRPARTREVKTRSRGGNAAERKFLRTGMTEAEVLQKIGRPDTQANGRRKEGRQWSYLPVADDVDTLTTVTFVGGKVSSVERKVVR